MSRLPESLAALRHDNFRWYWIALTVNMTGTVMAPVALAFAVLSITDSASALGGVLAAETAPLAVFLLFGGVIADRLPMTAILRVGMVVMGLSQAVAATLVITGAARIWMLVALAVVNGTTDAMVLPALQAILPRLVPRDLLQQANALQSFARGSLRVFGPTVAALLVVGAGPGWALAFDAATWVAGAVVMAKVVLPPRPPRVESASALAELRTGWDYFRATTWLWVIVAAAGVLNAVQSGAWSTLGPPRAKETFGIAGWGVVLSAQSVGLILATLVLLRRQIRRPLLSGMLGVAVTALPIAVLGWYPHVGVLVVCTFLAGAGSEVFNIGWSVAMAENVPEDMLSRAFSYDMLGSVVAIPIGQLAFGPLGAAYGYRDVLVVSGVVFGAVCLATLASRSVRGLGRAPVESVPVST
ncbi:MAG: MFS transporter [Nocardioides sp.]